MVQVKYELSDLLGILDQILKIMDIGYNKETQKKIKSPTLEKNFLLVNLMEKKLTTRSGLINTQFNIPINIKPFLSNVWFNQKGNPKLHLKRKVIENIKKNIGKWPQCDSFINFIKNQKINNLEEFKNFFHIHPNDQKSLIALGVDSSYLYNQYRRYFLLSTLINIKKDNQLCLKIQGYISNDKITNAEQFRVQEPENKQIKVLKGSDNNFFISYLYQAFCDMYPLKNGITTTPSLSNTNSSFSSSSLNIPPDVKVQKSKKNPIILSAHSLPTPPPIPPPIPLPVKKQDEEDEDEDEDNPVLLDNNNDNDNDNDDEESSSPIVSSALLEVDLLSPDNRGEQDSNNDANGVTRKSQSKSGGQGSRKSLNSIASSITPPANGRALTSSAYSSDKQGCLSGYLTVKNEQGDRRKIHYNEEDLSSYFKSQSDEKNGRGLVNKNLNKEKIEFSQFVKERKIEKDDEVSGGFALYTETDIDFEGKSEISLFSTGGDQPNENEKLEIIINVIEENGKKGSYKFFLPSRQLKKLDNELRECEDYSDSLIKWCKKYNSTLPGIKREIGNDFKPYINSAHNISEDFKNKIKEGQNNQKDKGKIDFSKNTDTGGNQEKIDLAEPEETEDYASLLFGGDQSDGGENPVSILFDDEPKNEEEEEEEELELGLGLDGAETEKEQKSTISTDRSRSR